MPRLQEHRQGVVVAALLAAACGAADSSPAAAPLRSPMTVSVSSRRRPDPPPPPAPPAVEMAAEPPRADDDLTFCIDEVNRYRKRAGKPLLRRSAQLDAFAADAARVDSEARRPHKHFSTVAYPHPYREMGENEIPWWPQRQHGSVRDIIRYGLAGMWDEGPGGGHYENLVADYTLVGCGIHIQNGEVTVVQDFLRPPP